MSYHIYTTTAIVLSERPSREADCIYTLFTRDLGLIRASATGARKDLSKLRGHLQPFSVSCVSLVRGREYWRLTSSELILSLQQILKDEPKLFLAMAKNLLLLEKLVAGEEKHVELFDSLAGVFELATKDVHAAEDPESIEIMVAARILFHLGYLSGEHVPNIILFGEPSGNMLETVVQSKKSLIQAINRGIHSSQLA